MLALILAGMLTLLSASQSRAEPPCDPADAIKNARLFSEAVAAYAALLKDAQPKCALEGLAAIAAERKAAKDDYLAGVALEGEKNKTDAITKYQSALEKDPGLKEAQDALVRLKGEKQDAFGFWDDLQESELITGALDLVFDAAKILAYVSIVLILIISMWRMYRRWKADWKIDIQDFDKGGVATDLSKSLSAMVEEGYTRLGTPSRSVRRLGRPDLITAQVGSIGLPDVGTSMPQFKVLLGLLDWLMAPQVLNVTGYLQESSVRGAGLTLTIVNSRDKSVVNSVSIWENDFGTMHPSYEKGTPQGYYSLADPAAAWVQFTVREWLTAHPHRRPRNRYGAMLARTTKTPLPDFGTNNWRSYAYMLAGNRLLRDGDIIQAYAQFEKAIDLDAENYGAISNLAATAAQDDVHWALRNLEHAIAKLPDYLESLLVGQLGKPETNLTMYYTLLYQRVAALDYIGKQKDACDRADELIAAIVAKKVEIEGELTKWKADHQRWYSFGRSRLPLIPWLYHRREIKRRITDKPRLDMLADYLERMTPLANVLKAYVSVNKPKLSTQERDDAIRLATNEPPLPTTPPGNPQASVRLIVQYNLACFYTALGKHGKKREDCEADFKKAMEALRIALDFGRDFIANAEVDPSLEALRKDATFKEQFDAAIAEARGDPKPIVEAASGFRTMLKKAVHWMTT